ncbi:hypothetical protein WEI85_23905 [Actinomycetes bacterium KLBMP 9797]
MIREQLAFEATCLLQCTDRARPQRLPERPRPAWRHADGLRSAALAEFNREGAAARLVGLLTDLGYPASTEVSIGGGRRRFHLHRVLVPAPERAELTALLDAAWRQGRGTVLGTDPVGASSPRHAHRSALAQAVWRAALLAGGRRLRVDSLGVRVGHQEMAAVLVRAGRLLGVDPAVLSRPGCLLVTVSDTTERARILSTVSTAALGGRRAHALSA